MATFLSLVSILALSSTLVNGSPIPDFMRSSLGRRDLFTGNVVELATPAVILLDLSLPLTYPKAGTVFAAGGPGYATWDATLPPGYTPSSAQIPKTANLVLGYYEPGNLHFNTLSGPLVANISLYTAPYLVNFTLPANLTTRNNYIFALMGSSGNLSPQFTILSVEDAAAASSSSSETPTITYSTSIYETPVPTTPTSDVSSDATPLTFVAVPTSTPTPTSANVAPTPVVITSTADVVTLVSTIPPSTSTNPAASNGNVAVASVTPNGAFRASSPSTWASVLVAGLIVVLL